MTEVPDSMPIEHDFSPEEAIAQWRGDVRHLTPDEEGEWFAHFPTFATACAHGDGPTIADAIADAMVSLNLTVDAMHDNGENLPPNDVGCPPVILA